MALLHRRRILYPRPNATDCLTVCDAACQVYQLCSYSPPPYSSLPSNSTPIQSHHDSKPFPIPLVAATSFIAAASLLLLLALCALHRFRRRHRRGPTAAAAQDNGGGDLFEVLEADGHHAWHIRTVGLDEPTIRSIAVWAYKSGDGLLGAASDGCPVCLADFRDGELLRLLPKCGHAFHLPCIDPWLRSHLNCPLCRAPIVAPATAALPPSPSSFLAATADLVDPNSGSSPLAEDTQIAVRPPETDRVEVEGETESAVAEPGAGIGTAMDPLAASSSSPPSSQFWVRSGPGEDGLRPVRQSVSMDSSSLAAHLFKADPEAGSSEERKDSDLEEENTSKKGEELGSASKGAPQQRDPRELQRSPSSSSSRRLFLSGHGRGRSAVLPL